ncbi:MFS transporter [Nesterenkonia sp. NBAIMH1]|uniref:MFS transporter n=1 Tax=Nesterenkonia sp. NBAIMH1 TaxID=2600320 RepID=UPI0011B398B2|nr:MFS transporter [Nesterenkonia sp. NBAIMH1]
MDLRQKIETSPMGFHQWLIIGVVVLLNALDGYDVLAISFTSNAVTEEFALSGTVLGMVMSAALVGMAVGAFGLGNVADIMGRRWLTLISLVVNAAGLFLTATAQSAEELALWRFVTGLGVGGILVGTNVIASEYSSRRRRGLAISIYGAGFGIGGALGGSTMIYLIDAFGWRTVYVFGGIMTIIAIALVLWLLPESPSFLYQRRPPGAEAKLQKIARRLGHSEPVELDARPEQGSSSLAEKVKITKLLAADHRRASAVIWIGFFMVMFGYYFVSTWTPRLMSLSGLDDSLGLYVTVMLTVGGTVGCVIFGISTSRWSTRLVLTWFTVLAGVLMAVFVFTTQWTPLMLLAGTAVGFFAQGCIAGLYALTPQSYPVMLRATGVGAALGIGRIGAIVAPTAVGVMTDAGWTPTAIYMSVGGVMLIATAALLSMRHLNVEANRSPREDLEPVAPAPVT